MSNYYVRRSDHLEHGILGSNGNFAGNAIKSYKASGGTNPRSTVKSTNSGGRNWKNHLYKLKMVIGGKVRYFYNDASIAAARAGSALNRGAIKARANFENAVGISAKRGMNTNKQRYQNLSSGQNRRGADLAKKNAQKYERAYNKSLLGRIENTGSKARKLVGNAASKARQAGESFTGSIKDEAYKVGKKLSYGKKSKAQKKNFKSLKKAGEQGRKQRSAENPNYTDGNRITEKKIREKKIYETSRRSRMRRGGKKGKAKTKPTSKSGRVTTWNNANIQTWEKATKKARIDRYK